MVHSAATLALAAGEDMKVVQERLGHKSITLTMNTYTHVSEEIRQRTAAKLDALFDAVEAAEKRRASAEQKATRAKLKLVG